MNELRVSNHVNEEGYDTGFSNAEGTPTLFPHYRATVGSGDQLPFWFTDGSKKSFLGMRSMGLFGFLARWLEMFILMPLCYEKTMAKLPSSH